MKENEETIIRFNDVCKTYQMGEEEIKALDKANFEIDEGKFTVIFGQQLTARENIEAQINGRE